MIVRNGTVLGLANIVDLKAVIVTLRARIDARDGFLPVVAQLQPLPVRRLETS